MKWNCKSISHWCVLSLPFPFFIFSLPFFLFDTFSPFFLIPSSLLLSVCTLKPVHHDFQLSLSPSVTRSCLVSKRRKRKTVREENRKKRKREEERSLGERGREKSWGRKKCAAQERRMRMPFSRYNKSLSK